MIKKKKQAYSVCIKNYCAVYKLLFCGQGQWKLKLVMEYNARGGGLPYEIDGDARRLA